jgi:hypothetical protein
MPAARAPPPAGRCAAALTGCPPSLHAAPSLTHARRCALLNAASPASREPHHKRLAMIPATTPMSVAARGVWHGGRVGVAPAAAAGGIAASRAGVRIARGGAAAAVTLGSGRAQRGVVRMNTSTSDAEQSMSLERSCDEVRTSPHLTLAAPLAALRGCSSGSTTRLSECQWMAWRVGGWAAPCLKVGRQTLTFVAPYVA